MCLLRLAGRLGIAPRAQGSTSASTLPDPAQLSQQAPAAEDELSARPDWTRVIAGPCCFRTGPPRLPLSLTIPVQGIARLQVFRAGVFQVRLPSLPLPSSPLKNPRESYPPAGPYCRTRGSRDLPLWR